MKLGRRQVESALQHLQEKDPILYAAALPHVDYLVARRSRTRYQGDELFRKLAGAIIGQQLSTKAADAIWARLETLLEGAVSPTQILRRRESTLRKAGLSGAKTKSLRELAHAVSSGALNLPALYTLPEEEAIEALSCVWGIGRWTAEMFLMFALERPDVFSSGDLGLRRSMETLYGLPEGVHARVLEERAALWSPHRSFACLVLWRLRDV